ncbi:MAG: hypothetical protein AB1797_05215 [bacterium]
MELETQNSKLSLAHLPTSLKVLITSFLITVMVGYGLSVIYLYLSYHLADREPGLSVKDVLITYRGDPTTSPLRAAIMSSDHPGQLKGKEREKVLGWIKAGASMKEYQGIRKILKAVCLKCHKAGGMASSLPLTKYEEVLTQAIPERGKSFISLIRGGHTHILGHSFLFLFLGLIICLSSTKNSIKIWLGSLPFVLILLDIASWWLIKWHPAFVYLFFLNGTGMGIIFLLLIFIPLYEMWM